MTDTQETKTAEIIDAPALVPERNSVAGIKATPRGERIIKLRIKNIDTAVDCHIKPLLIFIKEQVQRQIRRQTVIQSKLQGLEVVRVALHEQVTKAYAEQADNADELEKSLQSLYDEVGECELQYRRSNSEICFAVVAIPPIADGNGGTKVVTFADVDWDNCEETELNNASTFFLIA